MPTPDRNFLALYRALCDKAPTTGSILRARLIAQVQASGASVTSLALDMGRVRHYWGRKLRPNHDQERPLTCADLDDLAAHLRLDYRDLLDPVLIGPDQLVLLAVATGERFDVDGFLVGGVPLDDLPDHLKGDDVELSIWRLRAQAVLQVERVNDREILTLAPLGVRTLNETQPTRRPA